MKRRIAILLCALMALTPVNTTYGAEFSSGETDFGVSVMPEDALFSSDDACEEPEAEEPVFAVQDTEKTETVIPEMEMSEMPYSEVFLPDEPEMDILEEETEDHGKIEDDSAGPIDAEEMEVFQAGGEETDMEDTDEENPDDNQENQQEKTDISKCTVTMKTSVTYAGKAVKPNVAVKNGTQALVENRDYTLKYLNNSGIGMATAKITGIGEYEGTVKKKYKILPAAPKLKSAASTGYNSVKVTWTAVPGATSYIVYYKENTIKSWKRLKSGIKGTSLVHTSSKTFPLVTGKKYSYTVKAVKGSYVSGCDKTGKIAAPVPSAPKLGKVSSVAYNKLKITWSKVAGASGYYIYRKSGSSWQKVGSAAGTSFTHTGSSKYPVKTGTTYTYTVKAYRKSGNGVVQGTYNNTGIKGKAVPNKPVLVSVECGDTVGKIKINWKKAAGATNYLIYRKDAKGNWKQIANVKGANTLSYTHVSSKSYPIVTGKIYTYTVRSYTTVGKTKGLYDTKGKNIQGPSEADVLDAKLREKTRSILAGITTKNMTNSQKLYACWRYVTSKSNFKYWPKYPDLDKTGWQKECALDMLATGRGNCYSFACAFAALASEVGYTPSVVCGRVSGSRDGASDGLTRHCWVRIGGGYYDPEAQYAGWYSGVYGNGSYDIEHTIQKTVPFK